MDVKRGFALLNYTNQKLILFLHIFDVYKYRHPQYNIYMTISIITASYNYANYIEETIKSVLTQTYKDWELIIVDDGSTDNSVDIIKQYCTQDNRIKFFTHENNSNKGLQETLLLGISKAAGDWIAFLESDDMWREDYLEQKLNIIQKYPAVGLIFNDVELFGDEKKVYIQTPIFADNHKFLMKKTYPCNMFKDFNISNRILTFSTLMIKKEILLNTNFNTPVDKLLDWWLYIHIAYDTDFYYIPEKLTLWRMHRDSYISKNKKKTNFFLSIQAYLDVFRNHKPTFKDKCFLIFSSIHKIFNVVPKDLRLYKILAARKIKKLLGLPLKDSPLFYN